MAALNARHSRDGRRPVAREVAQWPSGHFIQDTAVAAAAATTRLLPPSLNALVLFALEHERNLQLPARSTTAAANDDDL